MNIQMSSGHPFTAELAQHWADMCASFKEFRRWQPRASLLILIAMALFAGGVMVGVPIGVQVVSKGAVQMDALLRMTEAEDEAKGSRARTDRFRMQAVDRAISYYVEDQSAGVFSTSFLADLVMLKPFNPKWQEREKQSLRRMAESRLKLLPRPSAETLEELRKRGLGHLMQDAAASYDKVAASYSTLLGREIKPVELVTESALRLRIEYMSGITLSGLK